MSSLLYELGLWCHHRAKTVLIAWLLLLALTGGIMGLVSRGTTEVYRVPGAEGQVALDALSTRFPELSGAAAEVVLVAPQGHSARDSQTREVVDDLVRHIRDIDGVAQVPDPYGKDVTGAVSDDGRAVLVNVQLDEEAIDVDPATLTALSESVEPARRAGYTAEVGGGAFMTPPPQLSILEVVGLVVALLVLIVTFRAVLPAFSPLVSAIFGAGATATLVMAATALIDVPGTAPLLALMIGVAVGIDYALFIMSRYREQLAEGGEPNESAGLATATAGTAVVFAGLTVLIALLALSFPGLPFLGIMGVAAAVGVASAVLAALTLVPALTGLFGERMRLRTAGRTRGRAVAPSASGDPERASALPSEATDDVSADATPVDDGRTGATQVGSTPDSVSSPRTGPSDTTVLAATRADTAVLDRAVATAADRETADREERTVTPAVGSAPRRGGGWAAAWARVVTAVPVLTIVLVTAGLIALALPAADLRLALPGNESRPVTESPRRAYDLVSEHFGPGANGPLLVTADIIRSNDPVALMDTLEREFGRVDGVKRVALATPNRTADTGVVVVIPTTGPTDQATADLVTRLRDRASELERTYDADMAVTGQTAVQIDISDRLTRATLPFAATVMGLSLLLLTVLFRSLLVPLTATIGFVLSTAATFGVVALVFEHGWGAEALAVPRTGPVISFMPIIVMGVLFGLAMDYQVFLVSRMRESYVRGQDARSAVRSGFTSSGPVVAAAAAIMIAVFASFVPHGDANLKPIAFALATGVLLDAVVVRMVLVPAVMALSGSASWWIPGWLGRVLPHMDVEGGVVQEHLERRRSRPEDHRLVVDIEGMTIDGALGRVVTDLDLHVQEPGVCVVQGPDGSGKSSVLLAVAGRMPFASTRAEVTGYALPEQSRNVQHQVALSEFPGVNGLDDALPLTTHIAEKLSTATFKPWAGDRDVQRVMDRYTSLLVAARSAGGAVVPRTHVDPSWNVGDLTGVERVLFGVTLAHVGNPPVLVVDETGDLRSSDDRVAVLGGLGYLVRTSPTPLTIVLARTEDTAAREVAEITGLPLHQVQVIHLHRPLVPSGIAPDPVLPPATEVSPEVTR